MKASVQYFHLKTILPNCVSTHLLQRKVDRFSIPNGQKRIFSSESEISGRGEAEDKALLGRGAH
ncbi:unnamed protein product [Tenebrio molitor]|nr:unnamed protein product [Tenebrio molitor]